LALGYSPNDSRPEHIKAAYLKLKELMPNVKVFSTETVVSIMIDEDATVGMAWNGDTSKASQENKNIKFIFPKEGFVIWVDNFSIPIHAPHKDTAYAFINFILRDDIAKEIALYTAFPIANLAAQKLLPEEIRNNPTIYPSKEILSHGQFQIDLGEKTLALYEKYWEELKMGG
jgi:spermidine/putrescine transport system substrate-binding protein